MRQNSKNQLMLIAMALNCGKKDLKRLVGIFVLMYLVSSTVCSDIVLHEGEAKDIIVPANETTEISIQNITPGTRFLVLQLHTHVVNISLSSEPKFSLTTTKTGSSVGLVSMVTSNQTKVTWYMTVDSISNISAVAHVQSYTDDDPLPGGCNQVFNIETDPSIVLSYSKYWTQVWFQWSNLATPEQVFPFMCGSNAVAGTLKYEVYIYYTLQRDFSEGEFSEKIKKMLTAQDVEKHGTKAFSVKETSSSKSMVKVTSHTDQGAMYSVVVTREDNGRKASYITAVTYACDIARGGCSASATAGEIILGLILAVLGAFLLFLGHRYFKITQFLFGFCFWSLLPYLLLSIPDTVSDAVRLALSLTFGTLGGGLWLAFWYFLAFPIASVFLMGLCAGYLVSATLFFTPLGNVDWWTVEVNYSMAFACVLLVFTVLLMAYTRTLSILSCTLVGSYSLLMVLALPLRASLKDIFLNAIYHQTEENYLDVKVVAPFNVQDVFLISLWPILVVVGTSFQFYRERKKPAFTMPPPVARRQNSRRTPARYAGDEEGYQQEQENGRREIRDEEDEERRPLLAPQPQARAQDYETTQSVNESGGNRRNRDKNFLL